VFRVEPGTTLWWATRPVWFLTLGMVTLALVALFARFEWRISDAPAPAAAWVVFGVLLVSGASAVTALVGIATPDGGLDWRRWTIPVAAVVGAALLGALPVFRKARPEAGPPTR
jgi:hypothetical protein